MTTELTKFTIKEFAGYRIRQREDEDGYLNGTEMCKVGNKLLADYDRLVQTKEYLKALSTSMGIPIDQLINKIMTGLNENRGTWIHPRVAIHLAQWVSPQFAVQVTDWVLRFMSGDLSLVKEVVDHHDAINNTVSEVLIKYVNNQLLESRIQINELKKTASELADINKKLCDEMLQLRILHCAYCNKKYASTQGLTNHTNNKCEEKDKKKFVAIIDFKNFKLYMELLRKNWITLKQQFGCTFTLLDWQTDMPKVAMAQKGKKQSAYHIYKNSSRCSLLNILNSKFTLPIDLLMDSNSFVMLNTNNRLAEIISDFNKYEPDLFAEEFKQLLNPDDSDNFDDE